MALKPDIVRAIEEIRAAYPKHEVSFEEDTEGGAFVEVTNLFLGEQYEPSTSWVRFRITFQYPTADVYPHFIVEGLRRKDGKPLGESFQLNNQGWQPPSGIKTGTMISRRSNRRDPATETAAIKLEKVLAWIRSRQ
jgi:hypothetical protein